MEMVVFRNIIINNTMNKDIKKTTFKLNLLYVKYRNI